MDPIERKPLPPPNANVTTLTEDDRAEFLARANEVINHYLSGLGSYWDEGPRKPMEAMPATALEGRTAFQSEMQGAPLPGLVSDKPMSFYPVQPPIFGFPEQGARDDEDWLLQLLAPRRGR